MPKKLREELSLDPEYQKCMRYERFKDHICQPDPLTGRLIEWEHAMTYCGRQIQEKWAIIPICYWAHRGGGLDKRKNEYIALSRATDEEMNQYPRTNFKQLKTYLESEYERTTDTSTV